jgi:hypothetical protein
MTTRALALLGLALATAGCVDARPNLFVAGLCGTPTDPADCKAPAGKCDAYKNNQLFIYAEVRVLVNGLVNILGNEIRVVAEVQNLSPSNADDTIGRVNGKNAIIEAATIDYASAGYSISSIAVDSHFTPVASTGTSTIFLPVLPAAKVDELRLQLPAGSTTLVVADVRLKGHYSDGSYFETGPFQVPVNFINATYDATVACPDPLQVRVFCYAPGQTGGEACVAP